MEEITINVCGDFYLNNCFPDLTLISEEILEMFQNSNINIINLESPVTKEIVENKINKTGPHLNGSSNTFSILKQLNTHLVTLANNHIMDYGTEGLKNTLMSCKKNSIDFVGAGLTLKEAQKPYLMEEDSIKIAILNFAENEWSIAEQDKAGANPLDVIKNVKQIKEAKEQSDIVIVIIHGGHEYYNLPSPRMIKQYRFYAENGASVIVGHHPHFISGYELFNGVPIFYSLGNFLFNKESKYEDWYKGLILKLDISNTFKITWELIPVRQSRSEHVLMFAEGQEKENIIKEIADYSNIISDENLLLTAWNQFLNKQQNQYLEIFSPLNFFGNRFLKSALRRLRLNYKFMKKRHYNQILNSIRCEAHFNASIGIIKKFLE